MKFFNNKLDLKNNLTFNIGTIKDLDLVYNLFETSFPPEERISLEQLTKLMKSNKYKLILATQKTNKDLVGFAFVYISENTQMLWLDFIAIGNNYQNRGYGNILFNQILALLGEGYKGLFLEIEIPDFIDTNKSKRLSFYEKLGCKVLNNTYFLPTPDNKLEMILMYKPINLEPYISKEIIQNTIISAHKTIHNDKPHLDKTLNLFINDITDLT